MNLWNAAEFYGTPEYNSLTLLERYFAVYPEDADKVILMVKGAVGLDAHHPSGEPSEIRRSIDNSLKILNGRKKIDIFEPARRDKKVPLEITFGAINEYVEKGLVGGIGLSEVAAATIHEAAKITKILTVENELSLASPDILENGVGEACAQYGITLVAYSPLCRGVSSFPSRLPRPAWTNKMGWLAPNNAIHNLRRHPRRLVPAPPAPFLPGKLRQQQKARRAG